MFDQVIFKILIKSTSPNGQFFYAMCAISRVSSDEADCFGIENFEGTNIAGCLFPDVRNYKERPSSLLNYKYIFFGFIMHNI